MTPESLYDDGSLLLDQTGLTIRRYYFPWAGAKRISYDRVRQVETRPLGWLTGGGRVWGSAHPRYWLPLDLGRAHKHTLVVIDIGRRVRPSVTPRDPELVAEMLRTHVT
ncbi:MAG: hypothetical protein WB471_14455 [Nocardioides sp.]